MNKDLVNVSDIGFEEGDSMLEDNLDLSLEEYKNNLNQNVDRKKKVIRELYIFNKVIAEDDLRKKLESQHIEEVSMLKSKYDSLKRKKINELREYYNKKLENSTKSLHGIELEKQRQCENDKKSCEKIEKEILGLKNKLDEMKSSQDKGNKYEDEVNRIEGEYSNNLKQIQFSLDNEHKIKKEKLKSFYYNKKVEYESAFKQNCIAIPSTDETVKEKKEDILKAHQQRIEAFKVSIKSQVLRSKDKDKEELIREHNTILEKLKESFLTTEAGYEQQKYTFATEQGLIFINNLIRKIKSISENKNSVFKNLLEFNQFNIKKKLKEIESNKDFLTFTNREVVLSKIIDLLSTISYDSIYEYLTNELTTDKEIIITETDTLVLNFEKVFSGFLQKVELVLVVLSPNFSF
jgi:hypothetical protein